MIVGEVSVQMRKGLIKRLNQTAWIVDFTIEKVQIKLHAKSLAS